MKGQARRRSNARLLREPGSLRVRLADTLREIDAALRESLSVDRDETRDQQNFRRRRGDAQDAAGVTFAATGERRRALRLDRDVAVEIVEGLRAERPHEIAPPAAALDRLFESLRHRRKEGRGAIFFRRPHP